MLSLSVWSCINTEQISCWKSKEREKNKMKSNKLSIRKFEGGNRKIRKWWNNLEKEENVPIQIDFYVRKGIGKKKRIEYEKLSVRKWGVGKEKKNRKWWNNLEKKTYQFRTIHTSISGKEEKEKENTKNNNLIVR